MGLQPQVARRILTSTRQIERMSTLDIRTDEVSIGHVKGYTAGKHVQYYSLLDATIYAE